MVESGGNSVVTGFVKGLWAKFLGDAKELMEIKLDNVPYYVVHYSKLSLINDPIAEIRRSSADLSDAIRYSWSRLPLILKDKINVPHPHETFDQTSKWLDEIFDCTFKEIENVDQDEVINNIKKYASELKEIEKACIKRQTHVDKNGLAEFYIQTDLSKSRQRCQEALVFECMKLRI